MPLFIVFTKNMYIFTNFGTKDKSFNNFSIYSIETPYNYRYLSKVNDTVILVYASADSITQAKLMIEKIGY